MVTFKNLISIKEDVIEGEIIQLKFITDIEGEIVVTVHSLILIDDNSNDDPVFDFLYETDTILCKESEDELKNEIIVVFFALFEDELLNAEYEKAKKNITSSFKKQASKLRIVKK